MNNSPLTPEKVAIWQRISALQNEGYGFGAAASLWVGLTAHGWEVVLSYGLRRYRVKSTVSVEDALSKALAQLDAHESAVFGSNL